MTESFDLGDVLGKYISKPSAATKPEFLVLYGRPGGGKGLIYGTPVYTPNGPVSVESLNVGDYVIGSDGAPVQVYGIWDRGILPVFRVTFSDGASVVVDGDHLWTVTSDKGVTSTINTREVARKTNMAYAKYLNIPIVAPVQFVGSDLPIPPYLLGALIADGYLHGASIQWTKNAQNVADEVNKSAQTLGWFVREITCATSTARQWKINHPDDNQTHSTIKNVIKGLNLNVPSGQKFIPESYLYASIADRWELVHGLFDGDGRIRYARDMAQYHTTSEQLSNDVVQLLWSLGISAQRSARTIGDGTWRVSVLSDHEVFKVSDNVGRVDATKRMHSARQIASVKPEGELEVRCIAVASEDQLYVTEDFIVTHNTYLAATASELPGVRKTLILDTEGSTVGTLTDFDDNKVDIIRVDSFAMLNAILDKLFDKKAVHEYDVVIIDTLDVAQGWAVDHFKEIAPITKSGEKDGFWVWDQVSTWTVKQLGQNLRTASFLAIAVVHEREEKTADGGLFKALKLQGSARDVWPGIPDVVAYLERKMLDGKPQTVAYFETDDNKVTKNRFNFPPKVLGPTIPKLFEFIDKRKETK